MIFDKYHNIMAIKYGQIANSSPSQLKLNVKKKNLESAQFDLFNLIRS